MIDKSSSLPLYHQIIKELKGQLKRNEYEAGQMIPSESELMALYGVSRMTVRLAIDSLEKEGYVKKIQGKGTFVRSRKIVQELNTISSWSESLRSQGIHAKTFILKKEEREADQAVADELNIEAGEKVYYVERIKTSDGEPVGWARIWILKEKVPGFLDKALEESVYDIFEREYNIEMVSAVEIVEARAASKKVGALLHVPEGFPLLEVTRVTYDQAGDCFELSRVTSRADMYAYRAILTGRTHQN